MKKIVLFAVTAGLLCCIYACNEDSSATEENIPAEEIPKI